MQLAINVTAVFHTQFNVGTGALANTFTDRPTIKDSQQRPIIPGSSYKGRLRHTSERILRTLKGSTACCLAPRAEQMCPLTPFLPGEYCPICRIFGSPMRDGALKFGDLTWNEASLDRAPTQLRTGVAIRRRRRVAEPQKLYNRELFGPTPQTTFTGVISGHLADRDSQALAALLVVALRQMHTVGSGRSGGVGHCIFEIDLTIDEQPLPDLDSWLKGGLSRWRPTTS